MDPQTLVCAKCWHDLFDTEAWQSCFVQEDLPSNDKHEVVGVRTKSPFSAIRDANCSWCAYIRSLIRASWDPDHDVAIYLGPSSINSSRPRGSNIFYLSIDCHSPERWVGGYSLLLHAWTDEANDAAKYTTARPVQTDVNSDAATRQLNEWMACCEDHERCSALRQPSALPTRVIEVSPSGRNHPRLLESEKLSGVYATLSYCWGRDPVMVLTQSNHLKLFEALDMDTLPLTFRDAILTARKLSIPYLWIDALCIIQDSDEDKAREIAGMKDIYASSALTIVAASAKSVSHGFLEDRIYSEPSCTIPVRVRPGVYGTICVNELDAASYDERMESLAKRAWSLQEQLLAQRTLTYTSRTMIWRCHAGTSTFGDSLYFPHDLDSGYNDADEKYSMNLHSLLLDREEAILNKDQALSCWLRLVTAYSLRSLTFESDKMNAIAGVASHPSFAHGLGPSYFAGLWEYNLARQLTWSISHWHRTVPDDEMLPSHRPATYRAPSWSWASVDGGVVHCDFAFDDDETTPQIICTILECSTMLKTPSLSPYGEVSSAQLRIRTPVKEAWYNPPTSNVFILASSPALVSNAAVNSEKTEPTFAEALSRHIDEMQANDPDLDLDEDPEATHGTAHDNMCGRCDESGLDEPIRVFCAAITRVEDEADSVTGLLLVSSGANPADRVFQRIGYFRRGRSQDFLEDAKGEICII